MHNVQKTCQIDLLKQSKTYFGKNGHIIQGRFMDS